MRKLIDRASANGLDAHPQARTENMRLRYVILAMLFMVTTVNYADRATLSIAGSQASHELGLSSVQLGYIFSAFSWAYVIAQVPSGWLLDRFGARIIYFISLVGWSLFTLLQGGVGLLTGGMAVATLFLLRFMVGLSESPAFPANAKITAAWFPSSERATASAIYSAAQYFAAVLFTPIMGWITHRYGWETVFYVMGALGLILAAAWRKTVYAPATHPRITHAELDYLEQGGALVHTDETGSGQRAAPKTDGAAIGQILSNRMLLGIYLGQYCLSVITYFFLTWFPIYLVQVRGMSILKAGLVASLPAICGFVGGILGGVFSDGLLRRGFSLTAARKIPIIAGMLLSVTIISCKYVDSQWLVIAIMALAFFGKGFGALGWAVMADVAPREIIGLSGSMFNLFGNIAGITTPIVIGYILAATGSFNGALVFVGCNAMITVISYLVIVPEIKRVELRKGYKG